MINFSKMELKPTNSNGENVLRSTLDHVELLFWKIVQIAFKNEFYKFFFKKMLQLPPKQDYL